MATKNTNTAAANKPAKPPRKPALTAAEKKAQREAAREQAQREEEAARLAFEAERPKHFMDLYAKALRVQATMGTYSEVVEAHSWWFDSFEVNARNPSFVAEEAYGRRITAETLQAGDVERLHSGFDEALGWFDEHDAEVERQRQERLALEARQREALAKLTPEDIVALKAMGLRHYG